MEYCPSSATLGEVSMVPHDDTLHMSMLGLADSLYLLGGKQRQALQFNVVSLQWIELTRPLRSYPWGCSALLTSQNKVVLCG